VFERLSLTYILNPAPPERAHAYKNFPWANIKVRTYGHPLISLWVA